MEPDIYLISEAIGGLVLFISLFFIWFRKGKDQTPSLPSPGTEDKPEEIKSVETKRPSPLADLRPTDSQKLQSGLTKTASSLKGLFSKVFTHGENAAFFSSLEEVFLEADLGVEFAELLVKKLKSRFPGKPPEAAELKRALIEVVSEQLPPSAYKNFWNDFSITSKPKVVMIVGVNGAGKTTTVGKLCSHFINKKGLKVLVGAADTFRAAATQQLKHWVELTGADGVFQNEGADPGAVAFDSVISAASKKADLCLIDTAGRLHTKSNLMDELQKVKRVLQKAMTQVASSADQAALQPMEVWLVVDGSSGQNALYQAREFHKAVGVTGVIVTKLDGSSKGGIVLAISSELKIPVLLIGVGESEEDLIPFESHTFLETILSGLDKSE